MADNLTITFAAEVGRSYRLLSSPDLATWAPVATNAAVAAGPLQFVRPLTFAPNVFHRVVTP